MKTHTCPGRCGRAVAFQRFACLDCWMRLPEPLRHNIIDNYDTEFDAHTNAMLDAMRWYRDNP